MNRIVDILAPFLAQEKITLVDVGSLDGLKKPWSDVRTVLRIIGFEPQDKIAQTIQKDSGDLQGAVAVGAEEGVAELHITYKPDNSSLVLPNHTFTQRLAVGERFNVVRKESVRVMSLDVWLEQEGVTSVYFLKIDTQGTEGDVLRGAQHALQSVLGLDIEVNFAERYKGQAYFSDIDRVLREAGFVLFDLQRRYFKYAEGVETGGPKGQLTHGTALYLRSITSLCDMVKKEDAEGAKRTLAAFLVIATVYGYYDYALAVLEECKSVLPDDIVETITRHLRSQTSWSNKLPRLRLRFGIARLLDSCISIVKPYSRLGTYGDETLGNL